jgi:hypothetical protein
MSAPTGRQAISDDMKSQAIRTTIRINGFSWDGGEGVGPVSEGGGLWDLEKLQG